MQHASLMLSIDGVAIDLAISPCLLAALPGGVVAQSVKRDAAANIGLLHAAMKARYYILKGLITVQGNQIGLACNVSHVKAILYSTALHITNSVANCTTSNASSI